MKTSLVDRTPAAGRQLYLSAGVASASATNFCSASASWPMSSFRSPVAEVGLAACATAAGGPARRSVRAGTRSRRVDIERSGRRSRDHTRPAWVRPAFREVLARDRNQRQSFWNVSFLLSLLLPVLATVLLFRPYPARAPPGEARA